MYTLGIDLHKEFAFWSLINLQGKILWQKKLPTILEELPEEANQLPKPCQAVLEPTGCYARYAEILKSKGVETHLAHPLKVKYIAESKNKNDRIDSVVLGQLLRTNFLPEAYLPTKEIRELRSLLSYRQQIIQTRTRAKNRMRMMLNSLGIKVKLSDLFGRKGLFLIKGLKLPLIYELQKDQLIITVGTCNSQIRDIKALLEKKFQNDDDIQRMMALPSFGLIRYNH